MRTFLVELLGSLLLGQCSTFNASFDVDLENVLVFGPGLEDVNFVLPVRYFYLQLVDKNGKNLTESPPNDFLSVEYIRDETKRCHVGVQLLNMLNGSYVVRYKIYGNCEKLRFEITAATGATNSERKHVAKSPYLIEGIFNDDQCYCPKDLDTFSEDIGCGILNKQIIDDLKTWKPKSINFTKILDRAEDRWAARPTSYSFCHYVILRNQLYRKCYGQYVGFKMFVDAPLLSLLRKAKLPDTEFLFNLGDWPLETKSEVPVISWCGSDATQDIVVPSYDLTESTIEMMGRQSYDIFSTMSADTPKWEEKIDKAIWRGRDSSQERLLLVKLSRENNDTIEAAITRFFFFRNLINTYGPETESLPFNHFFNYKYVINMDGTVAAYRFPYLLAGDSLVFKQESPYYEFFYKAMKPMVHYVPFKSDLSDLLEKIEWARNNPDKVSEIIRNARQFVLDNLLPSHIFCYYAHLLKEYSTRLERPPTKIDDGLELVKQPDWKCSCNEEKPVVDRKEEL